jgi:hypothetical protein
MPLPRTPDPQQLERALADKLTGAGKDGRAVAAAIILLKNGYADLVTEVLAGRFTLAQALKHARGRP